MLAAISFALLCAGAAGARHVSEPTAKLRVPTAADRNANKLADPLERRFQSLSPGDDLSVIVSLNESATQARVESLAKAGGFAVKRRFAVIDSFAARMTRNQAETLAVNPQVRRVEANSVVRAFADGPRESFGVTKAKLDAGVDGNADGDAASYSKNDLVAAVIDTGIDTGHADLDEGKVIAFANCSGQPCTLTAPVDDNSHGTLVAATLAGSGDARADRLYQGAASGAALVGVKVLDRNGLGTKADMIAGIDWVVAHKDDYGIRVVNMSIGIPVDGPNGEGCSDGSDALSAAVDRAVDAGLVVAVAAGNSGPKACTVGSPAAAAKALTVGAMADLGVKGFRLGRFSGRGPTADGRNKPDIVGPGVDITSAQAGTTTGYWTGSGTSAASPFVAGVALLMLDANPAMTPQQVKGTIASSAVDWGLGGDNATPGSRGVDVDYGAGRLDAYAAIRAAGPEIDSPPTLPAHDLREGSLAGTGSQVDYPLIVRGAGFPVAGTLIVPQPAAGGDVALSLLDPSGAEVARSTTGGGRQAELGYQPAGAGTYTLRVRSVAGSAAYLLDISADADRSPTAVVTADVTSGSSPLSVTFDGGGSSDPDPGDALTYAWDLDGDGAFDDGAGARVTHVFVQAGSYTVRLQVTDASGATATASVVVTVTGAAPQGLVAAYAFDEGTGASVTDASGNANGGSISGATWTSGGKFGSALSFDGVNDWVTVNDANSLDLTTGITLEAWVKPSALNGSWRTVLLKERTGGMVYSLYAHDGARPDAQVFIGSERNAPGAGPLSANAWSHLALTYDGANLRLYVNGTQATSAPVTGAMSPSAGALRIGGNSVWSEWFQGLIDDVRVYNRALSASEIQADMQTAVNGSPPPPDTSAPTAPSGLAATTSSGSATLSWTGSTDNVAVAHYNLHRSQTPGFTPTAANRIAQPTTTGYTDSGPTAGTYYYRVTAEDAAGNTSPTSNEATATIPDQPPPPPPPPPSGGGLVAAYAFDEGTGSSVADASGNGNAGTVSGAGWASGKNGSALSFDGTNDSVTIADAPTLHLTTALSLSAWVKPTAGGSSWQTVMLKEQPGDLDYALYATTTAGPPSGHVFVGGNDERTNGPSPLPLDSWSYLAVTYDGAQLRLYRDGVEIAATALSGPVSTSTGALRIGGNSVWNEWFHGLIDDVRIYNRALTPTEIQSDMGRAVTP